jgi:hypothetical protein
MKKTTLIVVTLIIAVIISIGFNAFQATQTNTQATTKLEMVTKLTQAQVEINAQLKQLSDNTASAAQQLGSTGLSGNQARQILSQLAQSNPYIIDATTLDLTCKFIAIEPSKYSDIEGTVSEFPYNIFTPSTDPIQTVLEGPFTLVEAGYGSCIMAPIFNSNNQMIGSLSLAFDQSALINATATQVCAGTPYVIWASDTDGNMIYEVTASEVGTNLFTDPTISTWTTLQTFSHKMVSETAGYGTYEYFNYEGTDKTVTKQAYWATVGIYDTEWRLIITNVK